MRKKKDMEPERRLARFPEKNPNPVFEMSGHGEIPYANDAARRVFPDLAAQRDNHPLTAGLADILKNLRGITAMQREVALENKTYEENVVFIPSCGSINVYVIDITEKKKVEAQFLQPESGKEAFTAADLSANHQTASP